MSKDKLHAILAVEGDLKSRSDGVLAEAQQLFRSKHEHFYSESRSYSPLEEGGLVYPEEFKNIVTTVDQKLAYVGKALQKAMDTSFKKEVTNTEAKADFVVDGEVLAEGVPSQAFLNIESNLKKIRNLYANIPTLPAGKVWRKDEGEGLYFCDPEYTFKTEKRIDAKILVQATKEHPAQVEKFSKDVNIGKWTKIIKSGMWTSGQKAMTLERVDKLIRAAKRCRQRANDVEVKKVAIGKKLLDYIHNTQP